jgi:uncharacterized protein (DUF1501 family)
MTTGDKDPVLVVLQLSGGNDYLNTVIPYTDPNYHDNRPTLRVPESDVLPLDDRLGLHPAMAPLKKIYDQGDMAIVHGIGYENSPRSHFRSMDIWHTCEPDKIGTEGWLARAIRDIDPRGDNPVTAVNIGQGLPRALSAPGVSVASVADVSTYGLLTGIEREQQRQKMLQSFVNMYTATIGPGPVMDYIGRTGLDALKGTDILKVAPERYSSSVEYAADPIAERLRDIAMLHTADLGTRIFYTEHGSFDTHATQSIGHPKIWNEVSGAIADFWDDLREHDADDNVGIMLFSEFGRRVKDNGSGTDHGAAGVAFLIGPRVEGGMHGEYPETRAEALDQGDLVPNQDFRGLYSSVLEDWLRLDSVPIVNGNFERPAVIKPA